MNDTTQTYQITLKRNLKMLKYAGFLLISFPILVPLVDKIKGQEFFFDAKFILMMLSVFFVFEIPALILHTQYLVENYKTLLTIDYKARKIHIKKRNRLYKYDFDEIIMSKVYKSIYYKDEIDNMGRWKTTFSDYGYWFMRFKDNSRFYFTSLMIDTSGKPLIDGAEIKYSFFSSIKRNEMTDSEIVQKNNDNFESTVKSYMDKFQHLSINQLSERISNEGSFQKAANEAFTRLIKEKKSNMNANNV